MSNRTCHIDGCENPARYANGDCAVHYQRFLKYGKYDLPQRVTHCLVKSCGVMLGRGRGRGFCRPHYNRWRKICITTECSIDGCEKVIQARGWCIKHWTKWQRYGDPNHRYGHEVANGKRVCPQCKVDKALGGYSPGSTGCCKQCAAANMRARRESSPQPRKPKTIATCICGARFDSDKRRTTYCSETCRMRHRGKANWKNVNKRRMRLRSALVEVFDRSEIFERDAWVCQLCMELTDRSAIWPDPLMPSLDHIIPVSRGGKHSRANAQTSHLGCNIRKGANIPA